MANETEKFGLPQVLIDFKTKGITAIKRSARGVVVLILKCESTDTSNIKFLMYLKFLKVYLMKQVRILSRNVLTVHLYAF